MKVCVVVLDTYVSKDIFGVFVTEKLALDAILQNAKLVDPQNYPRCIYHIYETMLNSPNNASLVNGYQLSKSKDGIKRLENKVESYVVNGES